MTVLFRIISLLNFKLKMLFLPTIFVVAVLATGIASQKNLAPEGNTDQSSTYTNLPCGPENAVTGNASNEWVPSLCTCTFTNLNQRSAWWRDDFMNYLYITNLTMYYRENYGNDLRGFEFYVTNTTSVYPPPESDLCYRDTSTTTADIYQEIHCNTIGRSVVFYISKPSPAAARAFILMCYLEINGCWKSFWGPYCKTPCPANCVDKNCYPGNGTCIWGCDSSNCLGDTCDKYSSVCTKGCKPGQIGRYCHREYTNIALNGVATQMPAGSSPANLAIDGNRTEGSCAKTRAFNTWLQIDLGGLSFLTTIYLTFGGTMGNPFPGENHTIYASNTSESWAHVAVLYNGEEFPTHDITTISICRYVIYFPRTIEGISDLNVCEMEIGGCLVGRYGSDCSMTCPTNCGGTCDVDTGNCIFGCMDGWLGEKCDNECDGGYYGNQCKNNCSENCLSPNCNHVDGECVNGGCKKGWMGKQCNTITSPQEGGGSSAGAISGGIGGVLAAIIIVAVVIIIVRKRQTNKGNKPKYGETLEKPDEMTDNMYENTKTSIEESQSEQNYDLCGMHNNASYEDYKFRDDQHVYNEMPAVSSESK